MNDFDRWLERIVRREEILDRMAQKVSPEGTWFAWYPVYGWNYSKRTHGWLWMQRVTWFNCMGMGYEYFSVKGAP